MLNHDLSLKPLSPDALKHLVLTALHHDILGPHHSKARSPGTPKPLSQLST